MIEYEEQATEHEEKNLLINQSIIDTYWCWMYFYFLYKYKYFFRVSTDKLYQLVLPYWEHAYVIYLHNKIKMAKVQ
jgi:hypothetical protein